MDRGTCPRNGGGSTRWSLRRQIYLGNDEFTKQYTPQRTGVTSLFLTLSSVAFEGHITHFGPDVVFRSPNPAGQPAGCNGVYHWIVLG